MLLTAEGVVKSKLAHKHSTTFIHKIWVWQMDEWETSNVIFKVVGKVGYLFSMGITYSFFTAFN